MQGEKQLSDYILKRRIVRLEAELRAVQQQAKAQRQIVAQKYGHDSLALIDCNPNPTAVVVALVQKLVFHDEEKNVISETDSSLVSKIN